MTVRLLVTLNQDGSVSGTPEIGPRSRPNLMRTTASAAQRAVTSARPTAISCRSRNTTAGARSM